MRGNLDFSSWNGLLSTLLGLVLVSIIAIGIRLLFMQTIQRRRERENRQINERLKTLIAAYKILGGSFTGELAVDPSHLRDLRRGGSREEDVTETGAPGLAENGHEDRPGAERRRRTRDAVEAALADIVLLGTEEQVALAAQAARDMVAGRTIRISALVVSLRDFIREALDLAPIPAELVIPDQGPLRGAGGTGRAAGGRAGGGGESGRGGAGGGAGGGGGGSGGAGMGAGMPLGVGAGAGLGAGAAGLESRLPDEPGR